MRTRLILSLLVAAIVCASCTTSMRGAGRLDEPALGPIPVITDWSQVRLPIDELLPTPAEVVALKRLSDKQINDCLAANGVPTMREQPANFEAYTLASAKGQVVQSPLWGFYGTDTYLAYGYHRPPGEPAGMSFETSAGSDGSDQFDQCSPLGLHAKMVYLASSRGSLADGGVPAPVHDSRYRAAVRSWSACMAQHGYDYDTPYEALSAGHAADRYGSSGPTPDTIALAAVDIGCKNATNLVGISVAVQTAYENEYIATHRDTLMQFRTAVNDLLR